MAGRKQQRKKNKESVAETFYGLIRYLCDLVICFYMGLILVVLPLYNQEGYAHIGTDKGNFFLKSATGAGKLLLPLLVILLLFRLVVAIQKKEMGSQIRYTWRGLADCLRKQFAVTDVFVALYGVSVLLSFLFSSYKEEALWGAASWRMGLVTQLTSVAVYFLISRLWTRRAWLFGLVFPVSGLVFLLGYLNRFGLCLIDKEIGNVQFISTIGNINWYCGYLVSVFFGGVCLLWQADAGKKWQRLLLMCYVTIGFATLVTHGSSSGVVAMVAVLVVMFVLSAKDARRMELFWQEMLLLSLACLMTYVLRRLQLLAITYEDMSSELFTNSLLAVILTILSIGMLVGIQSCNRKGCYPAKLFLGVSRVIMAGSALLLLLFAALVVVNTLGQGIVSKVTGISLNGILTFSPTWGSNRGATWSAGVRCFLEADGLHKLFGVGPDCMAEFLYKEGSSDLVSMVQTCFGTARLTNAHNEWLTILVDMGLLGLISYAGMMISACIRLIRFRKQSLIAGACGFCVLAYTVNNFFSFQQAMNISTIFVIMGVGAAYLGEVSAKEKGL